MTRGAPVTGPDQSRHRSGGRSPVRLHACEIACPAACLLVCLVVCLLVSAVPLTSTPAGAVPVAARAVPVAARADPVPPSPDAARTAIEVTQVSPWVDPDGEFRVELRVVGDVPPEAQLRIAIHQRIRAGSRTTLRSELDRAIAEDDLPGHLQTPTTRPLAELGDPSVGVVVEIPVRSSGSGSSDRALLPTAGIHPVELSILDGAGTVAATSTVFLNRLPTKMPTTAAGAPGTMSVSLYTLVDGPAAFAPDGAVELDPDVRTALAAAAELAAAVPSAPLTLAIRPNLLSALSRSEDLADQRVLEMLKGVWRDPAHATTLARMTYARVDTGGLVAAQDGSAELLRQVASGDAAVRQALGTDTVATSWYGDDTVTTESLDLLRALGVERLVTSAERLRPTGRAASESDLVTTAHELEPTRLTTIAPDPLLTSILRSRASAGELSNRLATELMATWFTAAEARNAFPGPSAVLAVPPSTDPVVLKTLLPALTTGGPLSADPAAIPERGGSADGRVSTATLTARPTPDQGPAVRGVVENRELVDGFRSLAPGATTEPTEWELLVAQTLDREMTAARRSRYTGRVRSEVNALMDRVEMPKERRVVITARNATIPLRFRNGLPYDVTIELWTRSVRLDIGGGDRRVVVLHPGENRIDLPVTTRAPGGTLLRVDASSPDGTLVFPSVTIPVSSSTISGVGAALSVLSLLFLAGWWLLTVRRSRRTRRDGRRGRRPRRIVRADLEQPTDVAPPSGEPADSVGPGG